MRRCVPLPFAAMLVALLAPVASPLAQTRTTADGVFTPEQAHAGREVHRQHCARCHARDYYQEEFLDAWEGVPVATLYDVIELKMPEDRPGSLAPQEYVALLAWVFELNGLPPGEEPLVPERAAMAGIVISREKKGGP